MSPTKRSSKPKEPKPPKPWQRAEAGTYRSSDERFTISSEGPSRWFVTDEAERDELGLPRTIGPFGTLDAAKEAADDRRDDAPEASPLAERLAAAARAGTTKPEPALSRPRAKTARSSPAAPEEPKAAPGPARPASEPKEPPRPPRTWLDRLEDDDPDAARRARRLVAVLEGHGIDDAENVVRRDVAGNQPAVATALLARAILQAVEQATRPAAIDVLLKALPASRRDGAAPRLAATAAVEAVLEVLGSSKARRGVPGWALVERDGPGPEPRPIYLTPDDLRDAAG